MNDAQARAKDILGLSGLDAMRAMIAGKLPEASIMATLGFKLAEVEEGKAVFIGEPSDRILNPLGIVHRGFALTLIDSCCGCAAHTTLPAGVGYTTVETKVNFVRAITPATGPVRAEGRVISRGRTIITADGMLTDSSGKLLAHGASTLMVLREKESSK